MGLGEEALQFAKQYVALVDALRSQGVPEKVARHEARVTALIMMFEQEDTEAETCPLCGHGLEEE